MTDMAELEVLVARYETLGAKKKMTDADRAEHNDLAVRIQQARTEHRARGQHDPATAKALRDGVPPAEVFGQVFISPDPISTDGGVN